MDGYKEDGVSSVISPSLSDGVNQRLPYLYFLLYVPAVVLHFILHLQGGFMAHTYSQLYFHLVFGTKFRNPWLVDEIQDDVWAYIGGIASQNDMIPIIVGGHVDHAHALVRAKPTMSISRMLQMLKGGSSWWIHQAYPNLDGFAWQEGYGAFSVSQSDVEAVRRYIAGQKEHHRARDFKEEYLRLLKEANVEFDERFLFD